MRVLTWNLYHGRSEPPSGRDLLEDFAALIAGWEWDVALLQEVPPWWPRPLAERAGASMRMGITGRVVVPPVQRALARRFPDVLKSWGGGSNAILVRSSRVVDHRTKVLRWLPERRWMHAVALEDGTWIGNLHTQTRPRPRPERDIAIAAAALADWSAGSLRVALGGDFNIPDPYVDWLGFRAGHGVDHVLATVGLGKAERLEAGSLSDHPPLRISLRG